MKQHIDQEADALYLRLDDSAIVESEEVAPGVVLDYNESNQVVGIEMLYLSETLTQSESLHPRIRNSLTGYTVPSVRPQFGTPVCIWCAHSAQNRGLTNQSAITF